MGRQGHKPIGGFDLEVKDPGAKSSDPSDRFKQRKMKKKLKKRRKSLVSSSVVVADPASEDQPSGVGSLQREDDARDLLIDASIPKTKKPKQVPTASSSSSSSSSTRKPASAHKYRTPTTPSERALRRGRLENNTADKDGGGGDDNEDGDDDDEDPHHEHDACGSDCDHDHDHDHDSDDHDSDEEDEGGAIHRPLHKATLKLEKRLYVPCSQPPLKGEGEEKWNGAPVDVFKWMIHPILPEEFFKTYWEKRPLHIKRNSRFHYKGLFGKEILDSIVRENYLKFGTNIDMARYENSTRTTENPSGRVRPNVMWALFEDGCSIRVLNPQTYHKPAWRMVAALSDYFGCMVGSNTYTTPKGSQGFAPHYDDIEAFLLQVEGEKHWRVYDNPDGVDLPRTSSRNFTQDELGSPILECTLRAGDLLYLPRGMVHQGVSSTSADSVHITMSTYQLFDWGQYLSKLVPRAVETCMEECPDFRKGLPINFLDYMGVSKTDQQPQMREKFEKVARRLLAKLGDYASFDAAADEMAIENLHNNMPPCLSYKQEVLSGRVAPAELHRKKLAARAKKQQQQQQQRAKNGASEGDDSSDDGGINNSGHGDHASRDEVALVPSDIDPDTFIRALSPRALRLVPDDEHTVSLYHAFDNGMFYHAEDLQSIEFPIEYASALEQVCNSPHYMQVCDLDDLQEPEQVDLVTSLFDAGLLEVTNKEPPNYGQHQQHSS